MGTAQGLYFDDYSPVGDILVIAVCTVMIILVAASYINQTKAFRMFLSMVLLLALGAASDLVYHEAYLNITDGNYTFVYVVRVFYHAFLFSILLVMVMYITELQRLEFKIKVPAIAIASIIYIVVILTDIVTAVKGTGLRLNSKGEEISGVNVFLVGYMCFILVIVLLMIIFRDRLFKRVVVGFYGTMAMSFLVFYNQGRHGQSSFTAATFLFPLIAMLYFIHSTPYDVELGAIDAKALNNMVKYHYERKNPLILMSLYLPDFDGEGKVIPKEMQAIIRRFASSFFNGAVLFQINNGHVILMAKKNSNLDFENRINKLINAFYVEYEKFQHDFKIVMGETIDEISRKCEYISFINNIHRNMEMNTIHEIDFDDVTEFNKYEYILEELEDIYRTHNLRDPRVLAYCQPVFNIKKQKYDTAEALMRLKLHDIGMVFPDQFIPLAEEHGYIHVLTEIILQKTCDEIRHLLSEGYEVKRISINVSVPELREESFIDDIERIIKESGIPENKVAIEITESQTESDFLIMKKTIDALKDKGVKFYLDDFGTGYSNMERIMEIPFDIIKFDRSLVLASNSNEKSEKMVGSLANMFSEMDYSVLYEGVENDMDEKRCIKMSASYLQGYKYSRPIPIIELNRFFTKLND